MPDFVAYILPFFKLTVFMIGNEGICAFWISYNPSSVSSKGLSEGASAWEENTLAPLVFSPRLIVSSTIQTDVECRVQAYMKKMDLLSCESLHLGQGLDEVDLSLSVQRVDQKVDNRNSIVHNTTLDSYLVAGIKNERFSIVLPYGLCLVFRSHKGKELAIGWKTSGFPASQEGPPEIARGTGDHNIVRGHYQRSGPSGTG